MSVAASSDNRAMHRRFRLLVVCHLLLATLPLLVPLVPLELEFLPVIFFVLTVPFLATLMLLAFWVGMGNGPFAWRMLWGIVGAFYIAVTSTLGVLLLYESAMPEKGRILLTNGLLNVVVLGVLGVGFLIYGRKVVLRQMDENLLQVSQEWRKVSLTEMFVVLSLAGILLAFIQVGRDSRLFDIATRNDPFLVVAGYMLFFANTVYASRVALGPAPVLPKVVLISCLAFLLGIAMGLAGRDDQLALWLVPSMGVVVLLATLILVTSLLVVRSAGYRLVPRHRTETESPREKGPFV